MPQAADAAGFQLRENDAVGMGSAFAGAASSADTPATVYSNPAGMTQLDGLQTSFGGTILVPSAIFSGTSTNALGQPIAGAVNRNAGDTAFVPYGYVVASLSHDLKLGLALTSPFGMSTDYGAGWVGRYQAETTYLRTININPAIAYRITPWLSVGGGLSAEYANADLGSAINSTIVGYGATGQLMPLPDGQLTVRGDSWSWGWDAGVLLQPTQSTRIGLAYHSRIKHDISGTATFNVPYPLSTIPSLTSSSAKTTVTLPDTAAISLTQQISPRLSLMADATWTDWRLFKMLDIETGAGTPIGSTTEDWRNSFSFALGGSYLVSPDLTLRTGTAFDKTPVTDQYRTPRVPDQDRVWLSVGVSYRVASTVTLDASYAHIFMSDAAVDVASPTGDVLSGHYSNHIDLIALGARTRF